MAYSGIHEGKEKTFQLESSDITKSKNRALLPSNLHGKTLKYPLDLENANGHYMIFNIRR